MTSYEAQTMELTQSESVDLGGGLQLTFHAGIRPDFVVLPVFTEYHYDDDPDTDSRERVEFRDSQPSRYSPERWEKGGYTLATLYYPYGTPITVLEETTTYVTNLLTLRYSKGA